MKNNIENGFRRTFFNQTNTFYTKNGDINNNTLKLIIQAIGRICRTNQKRKTIYNNLKVYPNISSILKECNILETKRAEELGVEDFLKIAYKLDC